MGKSDVLALLQTDLSNPTSLKSGEYLEEQVKKRAVVIFEYDKVGLVEAMREWIILAKDPETMLAVSVATSLGLTSLSEEIADLRDRVTELRSQLERRENGIDGDGEVWELRQTIEEIEDWARRARSNELSKKDHRYAGFGYIVNDTWPLDSELSSNRFKLADKYRRRLP